MNSARKLAYSHAGSARKNLLFCSKFSLDTLILLDSARYPKKVLAPRAVIIFANIEGKLGLTP